MFSYKLFITNDAPPTAKSSVVALSEKTVDVSVEGWGGVYVLTVTVNGSVLSIGKNELTNSSSVSLTPF